MSNEYSRRSLLGSACGLPLALTGTSAAFQLAKAATAMERDNSRRQLATILLVNSGTKAQPANFVTPIFGHAFKKGDVPRGSAPTFLLPNGEKVPFSMSKNVATWSNGSLKFAAFMLRISTTIQPGHDLRITVSNGGIGPERSHRSLSDFAAGNLELKLVVDGLEKLSGTWSSSLNTGIRVNGADYLYMDGAAGAVWRVRAPFQHTGTDHGQLEGWWYIAALQDARGGLGGTRHLCGITQPYYNMEKPAPSYRAFRSIALYDGKSLLVDLWKPHGKARRFSSVAKNVLVSPSHEMETGWLVKLQTTGTLPRPLQPDSGYFVRATGFGNDQFRLGTNSAAVANGGSLVTIQDEGNGQHIATPFPYVTQFGTLYSASTSGTWHFSRGAGSFSLDCTVRVVPDRNYLRATQLIPPFAFDRFEVDSTPGYPYFPMTAGPIHRSSDDTGERADIGPTTAWAASYLFNGSLEDELTLRTTALSASQLPIRLRERVTRSIPNINGKTYRGMPPPNPSFTWSGAPGGSGLVMPEDRSCLVAGFAPVTGSHHPDFFYIPYLIFGEPQYLDAISDNASIMLSHRYPVVGAASVGRVTSIGGPTGAARNFMIGGRRYNACTLNSGNLLRGDAWPMRDIGAAAGILPDIHPENASYSAYWKDIMQNTLDAARSYIKMLPDFVTKNGIWSECGTGYGGVQDSWSLGYFTSALCMNFARTENQDALYFLNYVLRFPKFIHDVFGTSWIPFYQAILRTSPNSRTSAYVSAPDGVAFAGFRLSWSSDKALFQVSFAHPGYRVTHGDKFIFNDAARGQPIPNGYSGEQPYYAVNVTGEACQLSRSRNGEPVPILDSGENHAVYGYSASLKPPYAAGTVAGTGFAANIYAGLVYASALGAQVDQPLLLDLGELLKSQRNYRSAFRTQPKYAVSTDSL